MPEAPAKDVVLTCHPEFLQEGLRIRYDVANLGADDIYLLDVFPAVDEQAHKVIPDFLSFYLCLHEGIAAYILKGIPPLPVDRQVYVRVIPLGTKLAPGERIERTFEVPLPLCEQNPWYYPPLEPEEYGYLEVTRLLFAVQFLRATVEGFRADPAPHGLGLYQVQGKDTVKQAEKLSFEMPLKSAHFFKRKDRFSRL